MFPPKIDIPFPFVLRWVTSVCILDYTTVAIGDKFGSVSIVRLPSSINDNVDEDPTGTKSLWDRGVLNGASQKAECICVIHIGEIPLSLQKGKFNAYLTILPTDLKRAKCSSCIHITCTSAICSVQNVLTIGIDFGRLTFSSFLMVNSY